MHPDFDPQPTLIGPTLTLRPLQAADFDALADAASDPLIWAGHPAPNRHLKSEFTPYFEMLLASGGTLVAVADEALIGCSRYYSEPSHAGAVCIGYTFLACSHWGGGTNHEMKRLMLDHAFATSPEVWLHIDPANIRSQRATAKLGAELVLTTTLGLGGKEGLWQCWRITPETLKI